MVATRFGWVAALLCAVGLLFACGRAASLRGSFPDNRPEQIKAVLARLPAPAPPSAPSNVTGRPLVVVALEGEPAGLAAFDASTGDELWRVAMAVDSPPFVGGPVVVVRSGTSMVGLSVRDGSRLWSRQAETLDFMGAAIDGDVVAMTFSTAGQRASTFREGRVVVLDAQTGRTLWTLGPVEKQLGAPAVRAGVVFVPWDRLSLSAFDARSGEEIARLLSRDDVIAFVDAGPEGVYYGSSGVYRLTERSAQGTRADAAVYEPLVGNAPRATTFGPDSFLGVTGGRNARNKIRFLWRGAPEAGDEVHLLDDRAYFLYFRILFAFQASTGEIRWTHQEEGDAEAAAVVPGGVLMLDGRGRLAAIDATTGQVVHRVDLGVPVATAAFDVPSLPRGGGGDEEGVRTAREQLLDVIFDPDTRLTPARRFAVSVLASIPDAEATRDLLGVCQNQRVPEQVRGDAALVLRTRQTGSEFLRAALAEHQDFLADREAPAVGVIAASVLHMEDSSAVPGLVSHLVDPETPLADLPSVAATLTALGDASIVPDLLRFIVRYRADSEFREEPSALVELGRAVARHGSDQDRARLRALAEQPHTNPALVAALGEILEPPAEEAAEGAPAEGEELRRTMSPEQVDGVMQGARDRIRPCVQSALRRTADLSEIRITMVVSGEGDLEELAVEPQDDVLGSCLTLAMAESTFPSSDLERQRVDYTIRIER